MKYLLLETKKGNTPYEVRYNSDPKLHLAEYDYSDVIADLQDGTVTVWDTNGNGYNVTSEESLPDPNSPGFKYHMPWTPKLQKSGATKTQTELKDIILNYLINLKKGILRSNKYSRSELSKMNYDQLLNLLEE